MKQNLFLLLALLITSSLFAQTNIPAGNVSGTWTKANSPYFINGDIKVPDDSLLTIEAGVLVEFQDAYRLTVDGSIQANGKAGDSISFLPKVKNTGWNGILFLNNNDGDSGVFDHCIFKYVAINALRDGNGNYILINDRLVSNSAITAFYSDKVFISNSLFETNWRSVTTYSAEIHFEKCFFTKHNGFSNTNSSLGHIDSSHFTFRNCNFNNNKNFAAGSHGLFINDNHKNDPQNSIINCTFNDNMRSPLLLGDANTLVENCEFKRDSSNSAAGMSLVGNYNIIRNCLFDGNNVRNFGGSVYITGSTYESRFENCTFMNTRSSTAITAYEASTCPLFLNCTFINNKGGALSIIEGGNYCRVINCLFENNRSGVYTGSGNHVVVNCNIINNHDHLTDFQGGLIVEKGVVNVYNSILWGNTSMSGKKIQFRHGNAGNKSSFYNCIIEGDSSSFQNGTNGNLTWSGDYENCYNIYPEFTDSFNKDWTLINSCSNLSYGYNKGFNDFIRDPRFPTRNVLTYYTSVDLSGNKRIVGDTIDIGAYEISNPKSVLTINKQPNDSLVCLGMDASFEILATGSGINYTWEYKEPSSSTWNYLSAGNRIQQNNLSLNVEGRQYRVKLTADCSLSDISNTVTLNVKPLPIAFAGKDTLVCDAIPISLLASGGKTYAWSNGSTSNVLSFTPTQDTVFVVEVLDSNGCTDKDSISIKKSQRPMVNLGPDKTIDDWGKETLDAGTHTSYLWNDNSTMQTLEVDGHVQGLGKHLFWVEVENADGCEARDSIYITVDDITHILEGNTFALNAYPNPTQNKLTFELPQGFQNGIIHVYSLTGNLIKTIRVQGTNPIIDMAFLRAGTYWVQLNFKEKSYFVKVVKE